MFCSYKVTSTVIPKELYFGVRSFFGVQKTVSIEAARYESEEQAKFAMDLFKSIRDKARTFHGTTIDTCHLSDDKKTVYIVSNSPATTLRGVLAKTELTAREKGYVAYQICRLAKEMHLSGYSHNGLSQDRIVIDENRKFRILTNYSSLTQPSLKLKIPPIFHRKKENSFVKNELKNRC